MRARRLAQVAAVVCLACSGAAACSSKSSGGNGANYFSGRTIEIITTDGVGGGADTAARVLAPYLTKYIQGHPKVKVLDIAGGGGIQGANEFANTRAHDGTHLLMVTSTPTLPFILGTSNVQYDYKKMQAFWEVNSVNVFFANADTGMTSYTDLTHPKTKLIYPATAPGSTETGPLALLESLGILKDTKVVYGYDSSGSAQDSVVQGETNFSSYGVGSFLRSYKQYVDQKKLNVLFTTGFPKLDGTFVRDPNLPNIPDATEVYEALHGGAKPSGDAWDAFAALAQVHGWALLGFDDVPATAADALNAGFAKAVADKQEISKMEAGTPYKPVVGQQAQDWLKSILAINPNVVSWLKNFIAGQGG